MGEGIQVAVVGLIGVVAGGILQFWLTKHLGQRQFERDIRRLAYEKYLEGISRLSFASDGTAAELEAHTITANARGQIALSGTDEVIMCMNRVFEHGGNLQSLKAREALKALITAMRKDTLGSVLPGMETELLLLMYGDGPGGHKA